MHRSLSALLLCCLSTTAMATTGRVQALSGNSAFVDDTDALVYPSVIKKVGNAVNLNYSDTSAVDGGVVWDRSRMLWFQRAAPASPSGALPFMVTYGQGNGKTGWLARGAWSEDEVTLGGAWSNGGQGKTPKNFAVGGDITTATGDSNDDSATVVAYVSSRNIQKKSHLVWDGRTEIIPDVSNTLLGSLRMGPRWKNDRLQAALSIGPSVRLVNAESVNSSAIDMPASNIAAEYALKDWLLLRGSATAALRLAVEDVSQFNDTRAFEMSSGGMVGVGLKHDDTATFDLAVSPPWLVSGPALLSGTTNPMFLMVSGRMMI